MASGVVGPAEAGVDRPPPPRTPEPRARTAGLGTTLDPLALLAVATLVLLGQLNLWTLGERQLALHQLLAVGAGGAVLLLLRRTRLQTFGPLGAACYAGAVLLLLLVTAAGARTNGARRWLLLGSLGIQPSELAKLGLLLVLAGVLARGYSRRGLAAALALAAVPIGLTAIQPDLSTALVLSVISLAALVLARLPPRAFLAPAVAAAVILPLGERLLRPYQVARLHAFLSGGPDTGSGWSVLQAHVAIASGGLYGLHGRPLHQLLAEYLPARQTDLAYASLVEQYGFIAGLAAVVAVALLISRLVVASHGARTRHAALVAALLAVLFGLEALVSCAGTLGLLPLAGVPFPFLSYGGTDAIAHLAALGMVLGTRRDAGRRPLWLLPRSRRPRPWRLRLAAVGLLAALAGLANFTWQTQVSGSELRQYGVAEMTRCTTLPPERGLITDRHGTPLAQDSPSRRLLVTPALLLAHPEAVAALAALIGAAQASLQAQLEAAEGELALPLGEVPAGVAQRLQAAGLPGVSLAPSFKRLYPYGALLGPLLGFVGAASPADLRRFPDLPLDAHVGRAGLEWQYEALLHGREGRQCFYVDPAGVPVTTAGRVAPVPGADLVLSLDLGLQREATLQLQRALAGVAGQAPGDIGAALLLDPRSGQVLAMASLPAYDDNLYEPPVDLQALDRALRVPGAPLLEHATQVVAPPGSTFKLVVAAADVQNPAIPPDLVIPTGYTYEFGGLSFHGWGYLPPQDLEQAIAWSNDVYFYQLALALGPNRIASVAAQLGAGRLAGIDLPGESSGFVGTPAALAAQGGTWYPGSTLLMGIGQGAIDVTPLQVARWTGAVALGATIVPRLGMGFREGGALTLFAPSPPARLPFASRLGPVQSGLRLAVTGGTGTLLQSLPVPAGGKTGTAEDPSNRNGQADAWFTAAAPLPGPQVVATVMVRAGGEGNLTSEPAAEAMLAYYFAQQGAILGTLPGAGQPAP